MLIAFPLHRARLPAETELWRRFLHCREVAFDPETGAVRDGRAERQMRALFEIWSHVYSKRTVAA